MVPKKFFILGAFFLFILSIIFICIYDTISIGKATNLALTKISNNEIIGETSSGLSVDASAQETQLARTSTGSTTYVYGLELIASKNTGIIYHFQNSLGSNTLTTSNVGVIQSKFTSYPYGKILTKESMSGGQEKFTFTGKEDDGKLMYYGARYMNPRIGQFISTDPIPRYFSNYNYANNNPLIITDPTGMGTDIRPDNFIGPLNSNEMRAGDLPQDVKDSMGSLMYNTLASGNMGPTTLYFNKGWFGAGTFGMSNSEGSWIIGPTMRVGGFSDYGLRVTAGEVSYLTQLKHEAPNIILSIVFSYVGFQMERGLPSFRPPKVFNRPVTEIRETLLEQGFKPASRYGSSLVKEDPSSEIWIRLNARNKNWYDTIRIDPTGHLNSPYEQMWIPHVNIEMCPVNQIEAYLSGPVSNTIVLNGYGVSFVSPGKMGSEEAWRIFREATHIPIVNDIILEY